MAMNRGCKGLIAPPVCGAVLLVMLALSASAQKGGAGAARSEGEVCNGLDPNQRCPGQLLPPASDPAVKARLDHQQNIKDSARVAQLAAEVKQDLENGADFTLSVANLKKLEEMAKLSKTLHDRMKGDNPAPKTP
jgi:hypothetical protein